MLIAWQSAANRTDEREGGNDTVRIFPHDLHLRVGTRLDELAQNQARSMEGNARVPVEVLASEYKNWLSHG